MCRWENGYTPLLDRFVAPIEATDEQLKPVVAEAKRRALRKLLEIPYCNEHGCLTFLGVFARMDFPAQRAIYDVRLYCDRGSGVRQDGYFLT